VSLALENAASFRQAQFEEQSAGEDVKQARAGLLPQLNMPLTYWGTTPSMVRQPGDPLIASFVAASAINESVGGLTVSGTIDVAGKLRAELQRSRALLASAHAGTMAARRNLVLATIDTYYGLALALQRRRLADEALALSEGFLSSLEEHQKLGAAEETDVLRARSAARSRRDELAQSQLSESTAMSQLRVLTGLDFATHITVTRLTAGAPHLIDLLGYQEDTIMLRPEIAQLDAQKRAALADARAARRELWPQLSYTLNGGFDAANFKPLGRYSGGSAIAQYSHLQFRGEQESRDAGRVTRAIARHPMGQPGVATQAGVLRGSRGCALGSRQSIRRRVWPVRSDSNIPADRQI
jgi:outer membrane protein, multidrug efflux system